MHRRSLTSRSVLTMLVLSLAAPALASAAIAKPGVITGGVAGLTPASATLLGKVNPNGAATTYTFRYGPTALYGAETAAVAAGAGTAAVNVVVPIASLAPATTYHYRLIATNAKGTTNGADRTFKTAKQPLGLTLAATANPVPFGRPTILAGTLSGTGNAGRQIVLQQNPFPYTQGFAAVGNPQLTSAAGAFAFPLLAVALNTQFRVLIPDKPEVASPIVNVGVAVRVSTSVSATHVRSGGKVRFFGHVTPARPGAQFAVQKLNAKKHWVNAGGSITRSAGKSFSRYAKTVRIRRGGTYRVFVSIVDGNFVSNVGRSIKITRRF